MIARVNINMLLFLYIPVHGHHRLPLYWHWMGFSPPVKLYNDYMDYKMSPEHLLWKWCAAFGWKYNFGWTIPLKCWGCNITCNHVQNNVVTLRRGLGFIVFMSLGVFNLCENSCATSAVSYKSSSGYTGGKLAKHHFCCTQVKLFRDTVYI